MIVSSNTYTRVRSKSWLGITQDIPPPPRPPPTPQKRIDTSSSQISMCGNLLCSLKYRLWGPCPQKLNLIFYVVLQWVGLWICIFWHSSDSVTWGRGRNPSILLEKYWWVSEGERQNPTPTLYPRVPMGETKGRLGVLPTTLRLTGEATFLSAVLFFTRTGLKQQ